MKFLFISAVVAVSVSSVTHAQMVSPTDMSGMAPSILCDELTPIQMAALRLSKNEGDRELFKECQAMKKEERKEEKAARKAKRDAKKARSPHNLFYVGDKPPAQSDATSKKAEHSEEHSKSEEIKSGSDGK